MRPCASIKLTGSTNRPHLQNLLKQLTCLTRCLVQSGKAENSPKCRDSTSRTTNSTPDIQHLTKPVIVSETSSYIQGQRCSKLHRFTESNCTTHYSRNGSTHPTTSTQPRYNLLTPVTRTIDSIHDTATKCYLHSWFQMKMQSQKMLVSFNAFTKRFPAPSAVNNIIHSDEP